MAVTPQGDSANPNDAAILALGMSVFESLQKSVSSSKSGERVAGVERSVTRQQVWPLIATSSLAVNRDTEFGRLVFLCLV